jgi:fatty-acyl-CoA synthase
VLNLTRFRTIVEAMEAAPDQQPFVTTWRPTGEETLTHGEFKARARVFAALYVDQGVKRGQRVVLVMPQDAELMAAFAGAMLLGAVPAILATPSFKADPSKYRDGIRGVVANLAAPLVLVDRNLPDGALRDILSVGSGRVVSAGGVDAYGSDDRCLAAAPDPDDIAFIQHSAGTTGLQKGVALPHRSVLNQLCHLAEALDITERDRIVSWLPLYHDMGLIACFILPLVCHLRVVTESPTDWVMRPGSFLQLVSRHRGTLCWQPNFAFQFLARRVPRAEQASLDLSSLRVVVNCSEPVRHQSIVEFCNAFAAAGLAPGAVQTSYAMAETTFAVTQSIPDGGASPRVIEVDREAFTTRGVASPMTSGGVPDATLTMVSSGQCLRWSAVRIIGPHGEELADGVVGGIEVRSDSLFAGYYNRPDLTSRVLSDGWYRTGDVGFRLDADLFVVGRSDDTIVVAGKNVYPQDVEEIASSHPAVHDGRAVAFGLENRELGTQDLILLAEVKQETDLASATETEAQLRRRVLTEIGVAPRVVRLMPPRWMVKSTAGKPARSTCRERFLRELGACVSPAPTSGGVEQGAIRATESAEGDGHLTRS